VLSYKIIHSLEAKSGKKRTRHTEDFKGRIALEAVKGVKTLSELSSEYKVHPVVIAGWKRQLVSRVSEVFERGKEAALKRDAERLTAGLYEEIGRLKMENDWFKNFF
jgi:putative transposase